MNKIIYATMSVAIAATSAIAKPASGLDHNPQIFVDESRSYVRISRSGDGYSYSVEAMLPLVGPSDRARLVWKQGGKVLATSKCTVTRDPDRNRTEIQCTNDNPLTAKGAIEAELIYIDDQDNKEYLIRTYKVTVVKFTSFGDPVWQILADDTLGAGWVVQYKTTNSEPVFKFWVAHEGGGWGVKSSLRCTVNGKTLDIGFSGGGSGGITASVVTRNHPTVNYGWFAAEMTAEMYVGKKPDNQEATKHPWLIDHPGKWSCEARHETKPYRIFNFTVDETGFIVADPMQQGKGATPNLPNIVPIELRIPKDSTFDTRIRPEAMKKSRGFGLPWPEHPNVKAVHASYPPASGLPDPK